jgi:feruloyl esterase
MDRSDLPQVLQEWEREMSKTVLVSSKRFRILLLLTAGCLLFAQPKTTRGDACENIAALKFANTTIEKAEIVSLGTFKTVNREPIIDLPIFCRIVAVLKSRPDSDIRVEMWLPQSGWNGRLEGTGSGGFAGFIYYDELAAGLRQGYAAVNTDMGLSVPDRSDAGIFANRPERWADWGYQSTHEMTLFAKRVVNAYYGRPAQRAYFLGCSTGGQQALSEAQHFPGDYDGLVGGAPPNNRTGVHLSILWSFVAMHRTPEAYIPPAKIAAISDAVLAACDGLDGVKDGVIADPRKCEFDPVSLQCQDADNDRCLTAPQVETARLLYSGPKNPRTGQQLHPGVTLGSEFEWARDFGAPPKPDEQPPFAPIFEWVFGPQWDWHSFDFDRQAANYEKTLAPSVNAVNPNLDEFEKLGHKLLVYHGWEDPLVVPGASIEYWQAVEARYGGMRTGASSTKINDFFRLVMVPGMGHCSGGPGADNFDPLSVMVDWVEHGSAPDRIIATKLPNKPSGDSAGFQRPLCSYPKVQTYIGTGNINDAASYTCTAPEKTSR